MKKIVATILGFLLLALIAASLLLPALPYDPYWQGAIANPPRSIIQRTADSFIFIPQRITFLINKINAGPGGCTDSLHVYPTGTIRTYYWFWLYGYACYERDKCNPADDVRTISPQICREGEWRPNGPEQVLKTN